MFSFQKLLKILSNLIHTTNVCPLCFFIIYENVVQIHSYMSSVRSPTSYMWHAVPPPRRSVDQHLFYSISFGTNWRWWWRVFPIGVQLNAPVIMIVIMKIISYVRHSSWWRFFLDSVISFPYCLFKFEFV